MDRVGVIHRFPPKACAIWRIELPSYTVVKITYHEGTKMNKKDIQSHVDAVWGRGRNVDDRNDYDLMVHCTNAQNVDSPLQKKYSVFVHRYVEKGETFTLAETERLFGYVGHLGVIQPCDRNYIYKAEAGSAGYEVTTGCWLVEYIDARSDRGNFFQPMEREIANGRTKKSLIKSRDIVGCFADFQSKIDQHTAEKEEQAAYEERYRPVYERFVDLLAQAKKMKTATRAPIIDRDTLEGVWFDSVHGFSVNIAIGETEYTFGNAGAKPDSLLRTLLDAEQEFPLRVENLDGLRPPRNTRDMVRGSHLLDNSTNRAPINEEFGRPETNTRLYAYHAAGFKGSAIVEDEAAIEGMIDRLEKFISQHGILA